MTTATLTRLTLSPMIGAAVARFPVGERAVKAAELLLAGKIQRLADDAQGRDWWAAYGSAKDIMGNPWPYRLSIKLGKCECDDQHAPKSQTGQKLCKHMLAAMYAFKAGVTSPATAAGMITHILAGAESGVKLYVREEWTGDQNRIQRDFITAYRIDGAEERVELAERLEVSMNQHAFWAALDNAGWERSKRYGSHGGSHVWELTPKPVAVDWPQPQAEALFADAKLNRDEDDNLWA